MVSTMIRYSLCELSQREFHNDGATEANAWSLHLLQIFRIFRTYSGGACSSLLRSFLSSFSVFWHFLASNLTLYSFELVGQWRSSFLTGEVFHRTGGNERKCDAYSCTFHRLELLNFTGVGIDEETVAVVQSQEH